MKPSSYTSIPHTLKVLLFPDATVEEFTELAGAENVIENPSGIQIRNSENEWFTLLPGWAAARSSLGDLRVVSAGVLSHLYRLEKDQ